MLQEGRGLYRPNELASVEVNVVGRYCTSDDDGGTFDQRERASMEIGAVASPISHTEVTMGIVISHKHQLSLYVLISQEVATTIPCGDGSRPV